MINIKLHWTPIKNVTVRLHPDYFQEVVSKSKGAELYATLTWNGISKSFWLTKIGEDSYEGHIHD